MKKTLLHGAITDKFTIKNIPLGLNATETPDCDDKVLQFRRYPAVFNSEMDAYKYLNSCDLTDADMLEIRIEHHAISFYDRGAVLVEFED